MKTMSHASHFAGSYREGRRLFLGACREAGLQPVEYVQPDRTGPEGEPLAIQSVWIGPRDARKVLLLVCGTHGLEAAAGSAVTTQWLRSGPPELPADCAALIVHPLNPFGWAWGTRGNEDNIDLNRNCLNHNLPYPENEVYGDLHSLVARTGADEEALSQFAYELQQEIEGRGRRVILGSLTAGQYAYPDGISYGGETLSWSVRTFYEIARQHLGHAEKIFLLDWHTGIGPFGAPHFILDDVKDSPHHSLVSSWWPGHRIHCDEVLEGLAPAYSGLLTQGFKEEIGPMNGAEIVGLVIEWGTYDIERMMEALLMDRWLNVHRRDLAKENTEEARTELVECFYPRAAEWRNAVLEQAPQLYHSLMAGLERW